MFGNFVNKLANAVQLKTETEKKLQEVLGKENWRASGSKMNEIARLTHDYAECQVIMESIWEHLDKPGKAWKQMFKALTLLDHLLKHGSERVLGMARRRQIKVSTLMQFAHRDETGVQRGQGIRDMSEQIINMLNNEDVLQRERDEAKRLADSYGAITNEGGGMISGGTGSYGQQQERNDKYSESRFGGPITGGSSPTGTTPIYGGSSNSSSLRKPSFIENHGASPSNASEASFDFGFDTPTSKPALVVIRDDLPSTPAATAAPVDDFDFFGTAESPSKANNAVSVASGNDESFFAGLSINNTPSTTASSNAPPQLPSNDPFSDVTFAAPEPVNVKPVAVKPVSTDAFDPFNDQQPVLKQQSQPNQHHHQQQQQQSSFDPFTQQQSQSVKMQTPVKITVTSLNPTSAFEFEEQNNDSLAGLVDLNKLTLDKKQPEETKAKNPYQQSSRLNFAATTNTNTNSWGAPPQTNMQTQQRSMGAPMSHNRGLVDLDPWN
eukprot:TRINITY_DN301_c0_g1_i1.p1 TRINITY_DN301_c0_g1~~TRINITY_DN301_c0_g1_i1.p1  ORF type:complete len:494 (-),score=194.94 TRINITY_DN301_c0_g1_i1:208-1689(-)